MLLRNFLIIIVIIVITKYGYPIYRGRKGEKAVKKKLKKLPKDKYIVLHNLMIETNSHTHQIDHVVLSKFGIFVIETKNYQGAIYGSKNEHYWIQCAGKNRYFFLNPMIQNEGHIKALHEILNCHFRSFISIICFSNEAVVKTKKMKNVISLDDLLATIEKEEKIRITEDLKTIKKILRKRNIKNIIRRVKHVYHIKKKHW